MTLTPEQLAAREGKLTASRVGVLMNGDDAAIYDLWRELTGDPSHEPDDLSGVWPVQLGNATEALNLEWYGKKTGHSPTRRGEVVTSQERPWAACTLDGWDAAYGDTDPPVRAVIEAKHVGGFEPLETVIARYTPQVHWQMYVTGASLAVMSVVQGAKPPVLEEVPLDADYLADLLNRADQFWRCVETLTPPVALPPIDPPRPVAAREVDMDRSNAWASYAGAWIADREAAATFKLVEKDIKALVPEDAARAYGHGIEVKRSRNGALSIRELKDG